MSWLKSNWKAAAIGVFIAAAGAVGIMYTGTGGSTSQRPLIVGLKHDSRSYLARHAQGWMTCPAAATKCYRWKMQEASGDITDDLSGDSAVLTATGTPTYGLFTPIPMADGFTQKAIGFNGTDAYFVSSGATVGDQTNNSFSISFWIRQNTVSANGAIVGKLQTAGGVLGYQIFSNGTGQMQLNIASASANIVLNLYNYRLGVWDFITVVVDRAANTAVAYQSGAASAYAAQSIAGLGVESITSTRALHIAKLSHGAAFLDCNVSEVMFANGVAYTLAEHQAAYKAFKVPTGVTYAQTTPTKRPLPPDATGVRLGAYGPGQWPARYDATLVSVSGNPLGLGFPAAPTMVNPMGYVNEFDLWSLIGGGTGATVTANVSEAPDGSMTADRLACTGVDQGVIKAPVGGGVQGNGEKWCASVNVRKISGDCSALRLYAANSLDRVFINPTSIWARYSYCTTATSTATTKQIYIKNEDALACTVDLADAQYEANQITDPCTSTAGNVSQTCNGSGYSQAYTDKLNYLPNPFSRGEIEETSARVAGYFEGSTTLYGAMVYHANYETTLQSWGGIESLLAYSGQHTDGVVRAKPLGNANLKRTYVMSWDYDAASGLSNTSPRRHLGLSVNGSYASTVIEPLNIRGTGIAGNPPYKTDSATHVLYSLTMPRTIEKLEYYARPAQTIRASDSDLVVNADTTGPAYLNGQAIPRFEVPSGSTSASTWIWDMNEFSGSLYDRINGVALAPTGAPRYQAWTGMLARGMDRRGANFNAVSSERIYAASTAVTSIGTSSTYTTAILVKDYQPGVAGTLYDSSNNTVGSGITLRKLATGLVTCEVSDGVNFYGQLSAVSIEGGGWHTVHCVGDKSGGTWIVNTYIDGVLSNGAVQGAAPTGDAPNSFAFSIAGRAAGDFSSIVIGELWVSTSKLTAGEVLTQYKRTLQTGDTWESTATTLAHYKVRETYYASTTNPLRDHSGNANHLTVVNGTPDAAYVDLPYPMGTGLSKTGVEYVTDTWHHAGGLAAGVPENAQPFSVAAWVKIPGTFTADNASIVYKFGTGAVDTGYFLRVNGTTGVPGFAWRIAGVVASKFHATAITDGLWHLLAGKAVKVGNDWTAYFSLDGGAFAAGSTVTGDPSTNDSTVQVGKTGTPAISYVMAGAAIFKNYALTDADVAAMAAPLTGKPFSSLTYARTNKACYEVGNDPITGVQVRCFNANEVPYAYNALLTNIPGNALLKLGLPVHGARQNVLLQSDDVTTTWTNTNTTDAANSAVSPDGAKTADTVTATAGAGDIRQAVAVTGAYTYCHWLMRNGSADVAGFIRLADTAGVNVVSSQAFTATSAWQRVCLTATTVVADTTAILEITTNAESLYVWGGNLSTSAWTVGPYCPTTTAAVTCNATSASYVPAASISSWNRTQGLISTTIWPTSGTGYAFDLHNGVNANGAIRLLSPTVEAYIYDNGATLKQRWGLPSAQTSILTNTTISFDSATEYFTDQTGTARHAWGYTHQSGGYSGTWPTYTTDANAAWTPTDGTNLYLGMDNAAGNLIEGMHLNTQVWKTR